MENKEFQGIGEIFKSRTTKKAPAHPWQDLALEVIQELKIPAFKRSSVFKLCKENDRQFILNCLNDTKELCQSGEKWKYFFKIASGKKEKEL